MLALQNQEGQTEQIHFFIPFYDSTGMIYMHWVPAGQAVNKEYYVEVLREFRNNPWCLRFRRKNNSVKISGRRVLNYEPFFMDAFFQIVFQFEIIQ